MSRGERDVRDKNAEQGRGIIAKVFSGLCKLPLVLLLSLLISIAIEWGGIALDYWDKPGHLHAREMMIREARFLSDSFAGTKYGEFLLSSGVHSVQWLDESMDSWFQFSDMSEKSPSLLSGVEVAYASAVYITKVFLLRITVFIFSMPLFVVLALVGIVFGLVRRDLRRFGAATEHKKRFVLYYRMINPSMWLSAAIYLTWPDVANPLFILVPGAFFLSYCLENAITNFQKSF